MKDQKAFIKHLRRTESIEKKLEEMDEKLDHIIFRLIQEDPRVYHNGDSLKNGNNSNESSVA
jgi:hypothetical protein